ncbi:hypothetical protein PsYK624_129690 [Phanerochaete sordida]|uniref:Uncharacterized protein n=1 Tax=Phanerochaete sordida TaxID=48140 RepID=A0A9P3LJ13_9APHY|nr:hypothetical protein PsYK624_129690 [Phanerochaete sordida]
MEAYATLGKPTTGVMMRGPGRASPSCALLAYRCLTTDILLGRRAAIVCIDKDVDDPPGTFLRQWTADGHRIAQHAGPRAPRGLRKRALPRETRRPQRVVSSICS